VITSNGGGELAVLNVSENFTGTLTTVTSTDDEGDVRTYSLAGADAGDFSIDANTGVLTFAASPNFEAPADGNTDNVYEVQVVATSAGALTDTQDLLVFVANVIEPGVPTDVPGGGGGTPPIVTPGATAGPDSLGGTTGADSIAGGAGGDTLDGRDGVDQIDGDAGDDLIYGSGGADFVRGLDGNDTIDGGTGDDDVNGNVGEDIVHGADGNDFVRGGQGADTVYGDEGDDVHVNGNIGDDIVWGGGGNDTCYGGQNNDTLHGESGDDRLSGDLGNDILYGGGGADRFAMLSTGGQDWAVDFNAAEGDRIELAIGQSYTVASHAGQVVIVLTGGATIGLANVPSGSFSTDWIVFA
jgi:Ca2+-binding RTX toxin-like protein